MGVKGREYARRHKAKMGKRCPECDVLIMPKSMYCRQHSQRGRRSSKYKTGRHKNAQGYIYLSSMWDHPNSLKDGRLLEHTFAMSNHLGRPLLSHETVHHKNGLRDDNRLENLELWSGRHPTGSRVADLVDHANWVLDTYGSDPAKYRSGS